MPGRNETIDFLRGFAVIIMISANAWPYIFPGNNCPEPLRLLFSSAAPIFVFLSGVSVRISHEQGKSNRLIVKRGIQIVLIATFIDALIWKIAPFFTMDVLYLISLSTFALAGFRYLSARLQLTASVGLFLAFFLSRQYYEFDLNEVRLFEGSCSFPLDVAVRHLFLDGWFPVLPWMSIAFIGYISYGSRDAVKSLSNMFMMIGIVVIGSYFCLAALRGIFSQPLRNGYTEVFYPVSNLFIGYLTGIWFLMLYFLNNNVLNGSKYVRSLGQVSLPVYFFHTAFISYLLPIFSQSETDFDWKVFSAGLGSFYAGIFLLSALLVKYKSALKNGKLRMIGQLIGI